MLPTLLTASSWCHLATMSCKATMPLSLPSPLAGHCPCGFKAIKGAAATTKHATAQVSEVITQTQGMHLRNVYLDVSKTQGWTRCFSSLCLYPGAANAHTLWSIPLSICNRACKTFIVAVGPVAHQCFQHSTNLECTLCLSACLQGT